MAGAIQCECGKQYPWKPELAGKRARCKCGNVVSIPAQSPTEPALEEDPFDIAALAEGPPIAAPPMAYAPATAYAPPMTAPLASAAPVTGPTMLVKIGMLAGGLLLLAVFAGWPMLQ